MNYSYVQGVHNGYNHSDERIFPVVPFLAGLVVGPLLYNAFNPYPYYGYPVPYPAPYPLPVPYGYGNDYGYGNVYGNNYGKGYY